MPEIPESLFNELCTILAAWKNEISKRPESEPITEIELDLDKVTQKLLASRLKRDRNDPADLATAAKASGLRATGEGWVEGRMREPVHDTSRPENRNLEDSHPNAPFAGERLTRIAPLPDDPEACPHTYHNPRTSRCLQCGKALGPSELPLSQPG